MLLTNAFYPDPRVHQEARTLVENGYEVTILCWDRDLNADAREVIDGINVERIYVRSTHGRGTAQVFFLAVFWLKAFAHAVKSRPHIIHCHDFDTLPLGYCLAKFKRARLVYDAHESYVDMLENVPGLIKGTIYRLENFLLRRTDLLITVGEILRQHLVSRGAPRSCIVGNWKDPKDFLFSHDLLAAEKNRLKISDDQIVISFIANLGHERQLPQLLEAAKNNPNLFLVVGGTGPARVLVETASQENSNICYLGYVNPAMVPFYTALSDIIFYGFDPSNPNARFSAPNKLFEAMAAGKPVITADFGEIAQIVRAEQCGVVLADYSPEKIRKAISFLASPDYTTATGDSSKNNQTRYSWHTAKSILLEHYRIFQDGSAYRCEN